MLWRHLCLVRAWSAAGLLCGAMVAAPAWAAAGEAEPAEPLPGPEAQARTVEILEAQKTGTIDLQVRGQGQDRVRLSIRNASSQRLRVVLPPGLVAASVTGQLQSMGLGSTTNNPGSFGSFRPTRSTEPETGFRSIPPTAPEPQADEAITVPAGQKVEFSVPAVCLNFGKPTPAPRDKFQLMGVEDYSSDPLVRKALRSLNELGTSHGVAQAVMWRVCNQVPFGMMTAQFGKVVNPYEAALAARFVEVLEASSAGERVDPAYVQEGRLFVQVQAEGPLAEDARRLGGELDGLRLMGLPARGVEPGGAPEAQGPALWIQVTLLPGQAGETRGRVAVRHKSLGGSWTPLGQTTLAQAGTPKALTGPGLAKAIDHAVASTFVAVKPARRAVGSTMLRVENHLPFTLGAVILKTGRSAGAPSVALGALGVGPARNTLAPVQAAGGTVERVELNGL